MSTWNADDVRLAVHRDLREIERLWELMPEEAEAQATGRDAGSLDAMNLLAPAANLQAWEYRFDAAEVNGLDTGYASDQTAELHPELLLGTWEDAVREERGQATDLRMTIPRACAYLAGSVDWMLSSNEYGDMNFIAIDQMADDLRNCRRMLEDIVSEGMRPEVSRVWCIAAVHDPDDADDPERVRLHYRPGSRPELDKWKCPECPATYDYGQFISAQRINLYARGADRFVLVRDAREALGVPKQTMDSWVNRLKVRSVCNLRTKRIQVWWPEVREADAERQRAKALKDVRRAG